MWFRLSSPQQGLIPACIAYRIIAGPQVLSIADIGEDDGIILDHLWMALTTPLASSSSSDTQ